MDPDKLEQGELLEQYVLGLTSREQNEYVEDLLTRDPEAIKDLEHLRRQLHLYAEEHASTLPDAPGRKHRSPDDFADLDHEIITAMTERNHSLVIWRYVLGIACLLLLGLCGFLFRYHQMASSALVEEKARHAQDGTSYQIQLDNMKADGVNWENLSTDTSANPNGGIRVHYLEKQHIALLDLSHTVPPKKGFAYYIFEENKEQETPKMLVSKDDMHRLYPVTLPSKGLRIYLWPQDREADDIQETEGLVAKVDLIPPH